MSSSRFPSISSTLSSNPVDETPPQSPGLYAFPSGRSSMSKSDLPKLPPTLPLRLPLRRNHSSHPNDSTATLTGTPSSPTNSHLFPSYAGLPNPSLSTITTPALTDNGSPSSSTSSRAPRTVPSALSLFHLPSRTNLKSSSPPSPISPAEEPTQHRYFNYYTASPTSSGGPSPATVLSPLSAASESRWSFATSEPDLTLASAPVSPTSNAFPGVESAKRIRNKSFHFPSLSLPSALGGEKKKKLVINGVEPGDARAMEAVRRWCESHGEVSRFQWKPDGLHVHFRKASVADTVSAVFFCDAAGRD
ncbi:hypothetical protein OE88DRAFT_62916 [Heliocybe sulcata]|uniref:Uncharacterized protein n=1 Tax=Heliocybe sulcata TaxID=5364 RepID=A0A5C3NT01_9AGAM|nr:hypothetical protein OE88DRAFT_62916 [Heliocybe sulcata]